MIYSQLGSGIYMLRLEEKDDILPTLRKFAEAKRVRAGQLEGIGSLKKARLGYYDFETKEYTWQVFEEDMEIISLTGNVAVMDDKYLPHVHVSLGRKDFTLLGGHLDDGSLANMVEIALRKLPRRLVKAKDERVGLSLLQLSSRF